MKVVVTGGAGFIGTHIVKVLLDSSHQVKVIDNLSRSNKDNLDSRAEFVQKDVADPSLVEDLTGWEAVIHLANYIIVPESVEKPVEYAENNVVGTIKMLESMRTAQVKKIIFSSSATVYGDSNKLPLTEETPLGVQTNPYGATKIAMESFISVYNRLYDFDVVHLRYFNPFGPFEDHKPETHAIPNFIRATLKKEPIPLYWKGEQIRDFIYIEDLASAHAAVLETKGLEVFNVGSETGTKIKDVLNIIFDIVGYKVEIQDLGERFGDAYASYASSEKLMSKTSWRPQTTLRNGLVKTIDYFRNRVLNYQSKTNE